MLGAILLPGIVLPKELAYGDLVEALGEEAHAVPKDLEVYSSEQPPAGYGFDVEIDGVLREADAAGFEGFHLVGYSGGGACALALACRHPERLLSLALLEPAWMGNEDMSDEERTLWREFDRIAALPPDRFMPEFVRMQLAPGVDPPPPPPGDPPPWMAKRPAAIRALTDVFKTSELDLDALRALDRPVYFALGELSNPDYFARMADRAGRIFRDVTVDVFEGRHHFDPPHRAEPERLAARLKEVWQRAESAPAARR